MLYIGIDIHKRSHEVVILDDLGKPLGKSFKIGNSHCDTSYPPGQFVVGLREETGGWYAPRSPRRIEYKAQADRT
jgi:hypothetical protein